MSTFRLVPALLATVAACAAGTDQPTSPASDGPDAADTAQPAAGDPAEPAAGDPAATCAAVFVRLRECTDDYIPALVSWRVELDVPAGIAAEDQASGRQALVDQAMSEWERDSTDEAIGELCTRVIASVPPEQLGPMLETGSACAAEPECAEVVTCIEPMQRQRLAAQKAAAGQ